MEATASSGSHAALPPGALDAHLSDQARHQLNELRSAIDVRLTVLEAVLADPSRGESLEGLILDLARVATEEAHAAATQACLEARSEAETAASGQATEALVALEEERAISSQLRYELEVASQRIAALEQQQSLATSTEDVDTASARDRATILELEQAVDEVRRQLDAERGAIAVLRRTAAKADEAAEALTRETARAQAAERDLAGERAKSRDAASVQQKVQAQLDAERATGLKLQQTQQELRTELARLRESAAGHKEAHTRLQAELDARAAEVTRALEATAAQQKALAQVQAALDAERATSARLQTGQQELAAEAARAREAVAAQQKSLAETKEELGTERATSARLQTAQQELSAEVARVRDAAAAHQKALAQAQAQLDAERVAAATQQKALAQTQAQLDAERAAAAKLRAVQERADELLRNVGSDHARAQAAHEQLNADLTRERAAAAAAQGALAQAQAQLEGERVAAAELRSIVEQAEQRLASVVSENVQTVAVHEDLERKLAAARAEIGQLQARVGASGTQAAEPQARPAPKKGAAEPGVTAKVQSSWVENAPKQASAKVVDADESAWRPVRLAHRYQFREPIDIQVNSQPGMLYDISITGCQLVSAGAVKPNQTVKLQIASGEGTLTCAGKVMWSRLEPPAAGRPFGYRAGVQFAKPDEAAIEAFVARRAAAQA